MIDLEFIRKKLQDDNIMNVSRETGIHYNTLYRLAKGTHYNLKYYTIVKLQEYYNASSK
jgi:hypothetical protein